VYWLGNVLEEHKWVAFLLYLAVFSGVFSEKA